jgi:hypothetical protein
VVAATVARQCVAVIAGLVVGAQKAVATSCMHAGSAFITIVLVVIALLLTNKHQVVATCGELA